MSVAAIYARYSTDQQRDASIEDQVRLCRERAEREGWTIANCYTDHALSGASLIRPGIQQILHDAGAGKFDIILSEALDRISRDQEDIAGIYKRMRFAGVKIVTLTEGEVGDLQIGFKGTMNALYLKDLADKTRRGLRGRVEAGKSGGGNSFGYDVVRSLDASGAPLRGDRKVNKAQAALVRRIFEEYAGGDSLRTIARRLNAEAVPGPMGEGWGPSTLHGNRERGTGILNNELYIGRLVWNRLRYIKDPDTGKRVSRLNPETAWIVKNVPELRIVDQALWDAVKERQGSLVSHREEGKEDGFWDRRRPRYLFSGLLKCGVCGGGFVKISQEHFGCATARNKGTCDNLAAIRRDELEYAVLDGLQHELMDPDLCEIFADEYTRHMKRIHIERNASVEGYRAELVKVRRDIERVIDAIVGGVPGGQLKERAAQLEKRKAELEAKLDQTETAPIVIHPNMGRYYRKQIGALREALNDESRRAEAVALIRTLVDRIILTPAKNGKKGGKGLSIDLMGAIAGILALSARNAKPASGKGGGLGAGTVQTKLVAGTRLQHNLQAEQVKLVAGARSLHAPCRGRSVHSATLSLGASDPTRSQRLRAVPLGSIARRVRCPSGQCTLIICLGGRMAARRCLHHLLQAAYDRKERR